MRTLEGRHTTTWDAEPIQYALLTGVNGRFEWQYEDRHFGCIALPHLVGHRRVRWSRPAPVHHLTLVGAQVLFGVVQYLAFAIEEGAHLIFRHSVQRAFLHSFRVENQAG